MVSINLIQGLSLAIIQTSLCSLPQKIEYERADGQTQDRKEGKEDGNEGEKKEKKKTKEDWFLKDKIDSI